MSEIEKLQDKDNQPQGPAASFNSEEGSNAGPSGVSSAVIQPTRKLRNKRSLKPAGATKKVDVAGLSQYDDEKRKAFQDEVLRIMGLGRSFNGAVARVLKIHAEKANDPAPDRATFYRWRKEDKEFGELVKATMEDEYGFAEEKEHVLIDGGYPESEEVEREWHITKDGKKGPLKKEKVKKTWAPPNQQAVIKGMDRRSRHIRRWEKNDGEVDKVPGPVAGMLEDENGNEIPAPVARVEVMVKMVEGKPQVQVEIPKEGKDG